MGYTVVKSFERGIDTRRMIDTTEMGGLLDARDCHVTRGGEVEKRAAFVVKATLPASTVGFYVTEGPIFHTWGTALTPPVGMPADTIYHSIPHPSGSTLTHILSVEEFSGKPYAVAQYTDATYPILHWWGEILVKIHIPTPVIIVDDDGTTTPVPPPPTGPGVDKPTTLVNFKILTAPHPSGCFLNSVSLYAPSSTGNFTGTMLPGPIDAYKLIDVPIVWDGYVEYPYGTIALSTDNVSSWAAKVQQLVNAYASTPDVSASASGGQVSFWVEVPGTLYNGWTLSIVGNGINYDPIPVFSGGSVAPPPTRTIPRAAPRVGMPGDPDSPGTFVLAHDSKMYAVDGHILHFSMNENADRWDELAEGAGEIDMTMIAGGTPRLLALADYGGDLAVFGERHILIYTMDPLPELNKKRQILHHTGLVAPHAQVPFGEGEVMYLDRSGVRSLRTRSGVEQAFASDLGTMIDELVRAKIVVSDGPTRTYHFWAEVEPRSGRLWMALHDKIFVLSYYPGSRISAWTWYDATSAPVDYMKSSDDGLFWRSGNNIISYGGDAGTSYDATEALVRVPYIDGGKPATFKNWQAIDTALHGTWQIKASFDPTQPTAFDLLANVTKSTYAQQKIAVNGESPAVSLEFRSTFVGPARVANAAIHFSDGVAD